MKARLALLLAVLVLGLVAPQARAAVDVGLGSIESFGFMYDSFDPDSGDWAYGTLYVYREVGFLAEDASAAPSVVVKATAQWASCNEDGCDGATFPLQNVAATAFAIDPLANAPSFSECLTPTAGSCQQFDITLSRPTSTVVAGCGPAPACANAWYEPEGSALATAGLGLARFGYEVAGTFAGSPFVAPVTGNLFASSWRAVNVSAGVTL